MKTAKLKALIIKGAVLLTFGIVATAVSPIQSASAAWKENNTGWWYTEGTSWSTGWRQIDNKWYYFDANGYMQANKWVDNYFVDNSGAWTKTCDSGKWVQQSDGLHFLVNGNTPATGWEQLQDKWYYFNKDGKMETGTVVDNGKEYVLDAMGVWNGAHAIASKTVVQPVVIKAENVTASDVLSTTNSSNSSSSSSSSGSSSSHHRHHSSSGNSDSSSSNKNNSRSNGADSGASIPSKIEVTTGAGATVDPVKSKDEPAKPVVKPEEPVKPVVKPADEPKPVVKPTDKPIDKPIDEPAVTPMDKPVVTPADEPVAKPVDKPVVKPADKPVVPPTNPVDPTSKGTTIGDGESEIYINNGGTKPADNSAELNESEFYTKVCDRVNYLVNVHRGTNNKTTLSISSNYKISSKDKSQDMIDNNYFAHERDGKDFQTLNTELSGVKVFGENIAMNYFQNVKTEVDATNIADTLFDQWKTSPGHNKNMLEDSWKSMGFGYAKGKEDSGYTPIYATQHFGY